MRRSTTFVHFCFVRTHETLSVAVCDVDGLKQLNDRRGHAAGDELLRGIAQRWRADARAADLIARIGGDEFAILLPGADEVAAQDVVERLVACSRSGRRSRSGLPSGISVRTAVELMSRADLRMYDVEASRQGPHVSHAPPVDSTPNRSGGAAECAA